MSDYAKSQLDLIELFPVIGVDRFGSSASGETVLRQYGFTVDNMCMREGVLVLIFPMSRGVTQMGAKFKVGDHVRWNSEAGHER